MLKSEVSRLIRKEVIALFSKKRIFWNEVDFGQKKLFFICEKITNSFQNIINFEWIKIQIYTLWHSLPFLKTFEYITN